MRLATCTGFPRYREFGKGPGISKTVFPVMKSPGICNFHHFSVICPGIWFALEMSGPERSVRFKAANNKINNKVNNKIGNIDRC